MLRKILTSIILVAGLIGCNLPIQLPAPENQAPASISTPAPTRTALSPTRDLAIEGLWGRLANPGYENETIRATLFFTGQARDGTSPYGCSPNPNTDLFTVHPEDERQLQWAKLMSNRSLVIDQMLAAGLNVVSMSSWGEDFLPCDVGWSQIAPMQVAPLAMDQLFSAATGKQLLIMPFIESRNDWNFPDDFPRTADGDIAPGTASQVINLIERYLLNPAHPEWAQQWVQVFDRNHEPRYAVVIIHAASNQLASNDHQGFAEGFNLLADRIEQDTGIKVGFFIDPLPPASNAGGVFLPSPEATGLALAATDAMLGIQAFIPEIWIKGSPTLSSIVAWKNDYSRRWSASGIPFLMDVSPGYDAHNVFPLSRQYGFSQYWQDELTSMVTDFGQDGLVFNSWNGYSEGMAAVPTVEHGDRYYHWLVSLTALVVGN